MANYSIRVVETAYEAIGVDTPEDLERLRQIVDPGKTPLGAHDPRSTIYDPPSTIHDPLPENHDG
jgi:hypothetical protein